MLTKHSTAFCTPAKQFSSAQYSQHLVPSGNSVEETRGLYALNCYGFESNCPVEALPLGVHYSCAGQRFYESRPVLGVTEVDYYLSYSSSCEVPSIRRCNPI